MHRGGWGVEGGGGARERAFRAGRGAAGVGRGVEGFEGGTRAAVWRWGGIGEAEPRRRRSWWSDGGVAGGAGRVGGSTPTGGAVGYPEPSHTVGDTRLAVALPGWPSLSKPQLSLTPRTHAPVSYLVPGRPPLAHSLHVLAWAACSRAVLTNAVLCCAAPCQVLTSMGFKADQLSRTVSLHLRTTVRAVPAPWGLGNISGHGTGRPSCQLSIAIAACTCRLPLHSTLPVPQHSIQAHGSPWMLQPCGAVFW